MAQIGVLLGTANVMPRKKPPETCRVKVFTVAQVAAGLGLSERRVRQLIAERRLPAHRKRGRWLVEEWEAYRFLARPRGSAGRRLAPATAWGVIAELAGVVPTWLTPSTHYRVRQRIRTSTPAELATAIGAGRLVIADYVSLEMLAVHRIALDAVSEFADRRRDGLRRLTALQRGHCPDDHPNAPPKLGGD